MMLYYDEISIGNKVLLHNGKIDVKYPGLYLVRGINGSGKSLLLSNINNHLTCEHVYIRQSSKQIFSNLSVKDNILLNNGDESILLDLLTKFNFLSILDLDSKTLSGGEKRLVSILRGLCVKDAFLLLDEPTNDLDYKTVSILINVLNELKKERPVFIVSHDDRFETIATCIFDIEGQRLICKKNMGSCFDYAMKESIFIHDKTPRDFNANIYKNIFSRHYILSVALIIAFVVCCSINSYLLEKSEKKDVAFLGNQINLFYLPSLYGSDMSRYGAYPLVLIKQIYENNDKDNIKKMISNYPEVNTSLDETDSTLSEIESTKYYDVYRIEYLDIANKSFYYPLDMIHSGKKDKSHPIDIILPEDVENRVSQHIDREDFHGAEKIVENKHRNLKVTYVSIVPRKDYSLKDFITSKYARNTSDQKVFIQSSETVSLQSMINEYNKNRIILRRSLTVALTLFTIAVLSFVILVVVKRDYIKTLLGYGFSQKQLIRVITRTAIAPIYNSIVVTILFLLNFVLIQLKENAVNEISILPALTSLTLLVAVSLLIRIIASCAIYRINMWKNRN